MHSLDDLKITNERPEYLANTVSLATRYNENTGEFVLHEEWGAYIYCELKDGEKLYKLLVIAQTVASAVTKLHTANIS